MNRRAQNTNTSITLIFAIAAGAMLLNIGCENCPDSELNLVAEPGSLNRGAASSVLITFPDPVFVEEPPARERDIRIQLLDPADAEIASWQGTRPLVFDQIVTGLQVVDQRSVRLEIALPADSPAGTYKVAVVADSAGACEGPHGIIALTAP